MKRTRRISISAAVTTGLVGLGAAAVAGVPALSFASAQTATDQKETDPDSQAAQERQELEDALDAMQRNTSALDDDLADAKHDLRVAEHAAAARAAAARAAAAWRAQHKTAGSTGHRSQVHHSAGASDPSPPATHGTTGASGSGGGDDGPGEDDGPGGDDGGGGDD